MPTKYFLSENGGVTVVEASDLSMITPEAGEIEITALEYETEQALVLAAVEANRAAALAAENAGLLAAYDALILAGFPPGVASTLSGYTPPEDDDDDDEEEEG